MQENSPASSDKPLAGRAALVTGSSRRIGRAIAVAFAEAGAEVAVHARADRAAAEETADMVRACGVRSSVVLGDVSDPAAAEALVGTAAQSLGRLDILVNNAAVRRRGEIETTSYEEWRRIVGVTLDGAFLCIKAAMPHLLQSPAGRIINIGGWSGHAGAAGHVHVIAAKAGLHGLTKALAHDLGRHGITVNTIAPGLIETEADDPVRVAERRAVNPLDRLPIRRAGTAAEVAAAVLALARPDFGYITGQVIHVNGGGLMP